MKKISFDQGRRHRADHERKNVNPENIDAETIFQNTGKKRRQQTIADAEIEIKKNDQQQQQIGFEPFAEEVEEKEFEDEEETTQD